MRLVKFCLCLTVLLLNPSAFAAGGAHISFLYKDNIAKKDYSSFIKGNAKQTSDLLDTHYTNSISRGGSIQQDKQIEAAFKKMVFATLFAIDTSINHTNLSYAKVTGQFEIEKSDQSTKVNDPRLLGIYEVCMNMARYIDYQGARGEGLPLLLKILNPSLAQVKFASDSSSLLENEFSSKQRLMLVRIALMYYAKLKGGRFDDTLEILEEWFQENYLNEGGLKRLPLPKDVRSYEKYWNETSNAASAIKQYLQELSSNHKLSLTNFSAQDVKFDELDPKNYPEQQKSFLDEISKNNKLKPVWQYYQGLEVAEQIISRFANANIAHYSSLAQRSLGREVEADKNDQIVLTEFHKLDEKRVKNEFFPRPLRDFVDPKKLFDERTYNNYKDQLVSGLDTLSGGRIDAEFVDALSGHSNPESIVNLEDLPTLYLIPLAQKGNKKAIDILKDREKKRPETRLLLRMEDINLYNLDQKKQSVQPQPKTFQPQVVESEIQPAPQSPSLVSTYEEKLKSILRERWTTINDILLVGNHILHSRERRAYENGEVPDINYIINLAVDFLSKSDQEFAERSQQIKINDEETVWKFKQKMAELLIDLSNDHEKLKKIIAEKVIEKFIPGPGLDRFNEYYFGESGKGSSIFNIKKKWRTESTRKMLVNQIKAVRGEIGVSEKELTKRWRKSEEVHALVHLIIFDLESYYREKINPGTTTTPLNHDIKKRDFSSGEKEIEINQGGNAVRSAVLKNDHVLSIIKVVIDERKKLIKLLDYARENKIDDFNDFKNDSLIKKLKEIKNDPLGLTELFDPSVDIGYLAEILVKIVSYNIENSDSLSKRDFEKKLKALSLIKKLCTIHVGEFHYNVIDEFINSTKQNKTDRKDQIISQELLIKVTKAMQGKTLDGWLKDQTGLEQFGEILKSLYRYIQANLAIRDFKK